METDRLSNAGINLEWGTWKITEKKETEANEYYHRPFLDLPQ